MHLLPEIALNLLEDRLDSSTRAFWTEHFEVCPRCRNEMEEWREMHGLLQHKHLVDAPSWVKNKAVSIISNASVEPRRNVRDVIASMVFDSLAQPALAGARGATDARQLVLRAEDFDIHLRVWGDQEHRQMVGQLLPRGGTNFAETARLHLLRNGERFDTTISDNLGEFQFRNIPEGLLSLQIDLPHLTVVGALNMMDIS